MKPRTKEEQDWPIAVFVGCPLEKYAWGTLDKPIGVLAEKFGGQKTGAGTGFGMRDVDCEFRNEEDAGKFMRAVRRTYTGCKCNKLVRDDL